MEFVNTVEVDFGRDRSVSMLDIHLFFKSIGIKEECVVGIAEVREAQSRLIRVKFNSGVVFESFMEKFSGTYKFDLGGRKDVPISFKNPNFQETFVRVGDVPFEVDLGVVKADLSRFGSVLSIRRDKFRKGPGNEYFECFNGWLTVKMAREKDIPSYLDNGGVKAFIKYPDQPATCRSCNVIGHKVPECPALKAIRVGRRVAEEAMVQTIESVAGGEGGVPPTTVPELELNSNAGPAAEQGNNNNGETINNQVEDIAPVSTETVPLVEEDTSTSSQVVLEVVPEVVNQQVATGQQPAVVTTLVEVPEDHQVHGITAVPATGTDSQSLGAESVVLSTTVEENVAGNGSLDHSIDMDEESLADDYESSSSQNKIPTHLKSISQYSGSDFLSQPEPTAEWSTKEKKKRKIVDTPYTPKPQRPKRQAKK